MLFLCGRNRHRTQDLSGSVDKGFELVRFVMDEKKNVILKSPVPWTRAVNGLSLYKKSDTLGDHHASKFRRSRYRGLVAHRRREFVVDQRCTVGNGDFGQE